MSLSSRSLTFALVDQSLVWAPSPSIPVSDVELSSATGASFQGEWPFLQLAVRSLHVSVYSSTDRGVYKQWPEWRMEKATEAVSQGKVSMHHAAMQFNIPKIHPRGQG